MRDSLEQLHLGRALETVDSLLDRAAGGEITTVDLLDQLFTAELAVRRERSISVRLKLAGLPAVKTPARIEVERDGRWIPILDL